jgi:hypothetical protein
VVVWFETMRDPLAVQSNKSFEFVASVCEEGPQNMELPIDTLNKLDMLEAVALLRIHPRGDIPQVIPNMSAFFGQGFYVVEMQDATALRVGLR